MIWGIYLGLGKRLQEHLEDPHHQDLLKQILEWQSRNGAKEVHQCLLEMIKNPLDSSDEDG